MIPTIILVGLATGLVIRPGRVGLLTGVAVVLLASTGWGLLVNDVLGGTALACLNVGVGLLIGLALQKAGRAALHLPART